MEYTPRHLDQAIRLSEGIFVKTSDKLIRICGFSSIYHARAHLNRRGHRFDNRYTYFGKTGLILGKKFGENRTNLLRIPTTIFTYPAPVLELADVVFHDSLP